MLVGLLLSAWLAAAPLTLTLAAAGGGASLTTSEVETVPEHLRGGHPGRKSLFYVRGLASYPATRQAREIGESIRKIAADPSIAPDSLRTVEGTESTNIVTT